ncbi:hypothetical protein AAC387_Pa03g3535 [Persea americana]
MQAMPHTEEAEIEEKYKFKWGEMIPSAKNGEVKFYKSFAFDGEVYSLYDCVYIHTEDEPEPYIGKLVKIWEKRNHGRRIKILWFFRPIEILNWLKDDDLTQKNEIFLACGEGLGLTNVNPLEVIVRKCNVVCTSKDKRNPQPSDRELKMADYIFYRTFDVGTLSISDKIENRTAAIDVRCIFNRKCGADETRSIKNLVGQHNLDNSRLSNMSSEEKRCSDNSVNLQPNIIPTLTLRKDKSSSGLWKVKVGSGMPHDKAKAKPVQDSTGLDKGQHKKAMADSDTKIGKPPNVMLHKSASVSPGKGIKTDDEIMEVTRRLDADKRKWFKDLPWEDQIQTARERHVLLLLDNLDPSYISSEVEDVIWHSFNEKCTARVIQRTESSSPYSGQAIVIFKSREAAETVLHKLNNRCLMLPNGRVLFGRRPPRVLEGPAKFFGHLTIDKVKIQARGEKETAVSTAHFAQANTIEYQMAMEWRLLQIRSEVLWAELYKWHGEERKELTKSLTK